MKIKLICVGSIKEAYFRDAISEYSKRLSKFCTLEIVEVKDEKTPDKPTENEKNKILDIEGDRILEKIRDTDFLVTLEIKGNTLSSEKLAKKISDLCVGGHSSIAFVIGGSLGLSKRVTDRSSFALSFSEMTFPHQLMRVILLEQIYRAFKINSGEPYHK